MLLRHTICLEILLETFGLLPFLLLLMRLARLSGVFVWLNLLESLLNLLLVLINELSDKSPSWILESVADDGHCRGVKAKFLSFLPGRSGSWNPGMLPSKISLLTVERFFLNFES